MGGNDAIAPALFVRLPGSRAEQLRAPAQGVVDCRENLVDINPTVTVCIERQACIGTAGTYCDAHSCDQVVHGDVTVLIAITGTNGRGWR